MRTLIHLVRHAEVENPDNTWYGRLADFHLSDRGRRQAEALAEHFAGRTLAAVYASPLARAVETAGPIAAAQRLEVIREPDIIESVTYLQGKPADPRVFMNPLNLRFFVNPFRPSWGEPYVSISARMLGALGRMRRAHPGKEVVAVSHMTPIGVARLRLEGDSRPPWMAGLPIGRASVTTLVFDGEERVGTEYVEVGSSV
ncbi:MAG: histidine phosphatase family protein [Acidimicrobiales bacterium]